MPVVRRSSSSSMRVNSGSSSSKSVKRSAAKSISISESSTSSNLVTSKETSVTISTTQNLRELGDVAFGILDESKDGFIVTYNETTDKIELMSPDDLLIEAVSDNDLPDEFVAQVVEEASSLTGSVDGGSFV